MIVSMRRPRRAQEGQLVGIIGIARKMVFETTRQECGGTLAWFRLRNEWHLLMIMSDESSRARDNGLVAVTRKTRRARRCSTEMRA